MTELRDQAGAGSRSAHCSGGRSAAVRANPCCAGHAGKPGDSQDSRYCALSSLQRYGARPPISEVCPDTPRPQRPATPAPCGRRWRPHPRELAALLQQLSSRLRGGEAAQNHGPHRSRLSRGARQWLQGSLPGRRALLAVGETRYRRTTHSTLQHRR